MDKPGCFEAGCVIVFILGLLGPTGIAMAILAGGILSEALSPGHGSFGKGILIFGLFLALIGGGVYLAIQLMSDD